MVNKAMHRLKLSEFVGVQFNYTNPISNKVHHFHVLKYFQFPVERGSR